MRCGWLCIALGVVAVLVCADAARAAEASAVQLPAPVREAAARACDTEPQALTPADLAGLRALSVPNAAIEGLDWVEQFPALRSLDLEHCWRVRDLTPLAGLDHLQALDLSSTAVTDLTPLKGLSRVRRVELRHTEIDDLTPLADLVGLEHLDLHGTEVADLVPLRGLTNLEWLDLGETPFQDVAPLRGLVRMRHLCLSGRRIYKIGAIGNMTELRHLDLSDMSIFHLGLVEPMRKLQVLDASGNRWIDDLRPLADKRDLRVLRLRGTKVHDLRPIKELSKLEELVLRSRTLRGEEVDRLQDSLPPMPVEPEDADVF